MTSLLGNAFAVALHRAISVRLIAFILFCLAGSALAQPIGAWHVHGAYLNTKTLAKVGNTIYAAGDLSAFRYETGTGELSSLTRLDGLSDNAYSFIAYNEPERTLVIAYSTGNIDLVRDGQVENISALLSANIVGSRAINHIAFDGSLAYLSCDFGFVVLDLARREIKASNTNLDISSANAPIKVYAADASGDSLFLMTSQGIMAIHKNLNLMDSRQYKLWPYQSGQGLPNNPDPTRLITLFRFGGRMYVGTKGPFGFYSLGDDNQWNKTSPGFFPDPNDLWTVTAGLKGVLISQDNFVFWKKSPNDPTIVFRDSILVDPREAIFGEEGVIYVADRASGLVKITVGESATTYEAFRPNGPGFELPFSLYAKGSRLYALSGGYETSVFGGLSNGSGYSLYEGGFWSKYSQFGGNFPRDVTDVVNAYETATTLFLTSFGYGVIVKDKKTEEYTRINDVFGKPNTLVSAAPQDPGHYVRITDMTQDNQGYYWVLNASTHQALHRWNGDTTWTSYDLPYVNSDNGVQLLIDEFNTKWVRILPQRASGASVIAFQEGTPNQTAIITPTKGQGGLPNLSVYDMAFDKQGILWIGTGAGLAALYSPSVVLSGDPFDVTLPIFDGRPLLENDIVTSIAIDGGDRKWVGTRNSGVWLFDKDVSKTLANYTFENSPLPSNNINDLAITGDAGELYIATEKGLVSLRIDATDAPQEAKNNCVKIFPNPVRPDFTGTIGIECLPENAVVKITDEANRLVYETRANGGTATWNGKNYNGRKAAAGIYYVYAVTQGQRSGVVGKIAIVR